MKNRVLTGNGTLAWLMQCINQIDCEDERNLENSKNPEDKVLVDSLNGPIKELEKNFGKKGNGSTKGKLGNSLNESNKELENNFDKNNNGSSKGKTVDSVKTNPVQRQQVQVKQTDRTTDQEIER